MNPGQDIIYGVSGQTLYWDAPEGRPSSVSSVTVLEMAQGDDGTAESATTGSAAVETDPDTTIDAATGTGQSNRRLIKIAATTGVEIGRYYLLTNAEGVQEWAEIVEISSGDYVVPRVPLTVDYQVGDTFQSTRIEISVLDAWAADDSNISDDLDPNHRYRVRWVYVVGGVTHVHNSYFDLVREPGGHTVTPLDMERALPNWTELLPVYHQRDDGRALIDEAYAQVTDDFHIAGLPDEMARNRERVNRLVKARAALNLIRSQVMVGGASDLQLEEASTEYNRLMDGLVRVTRSITHSADTSGAATLVPAAPLYRR